MAKEPMRYVFFGTPRVARIVLEELLDAGLSPLAVVCNPDRPHGRTKQLAPPPVKRLVIDRGLENTVRVFQPERLDEIHNELASLQADVFVVMAYSKILREETLHIPRLGTVGIHPSLLPAYRGPTPFQTALLEGATETGVALFLVDKEVDHGPVLAEVRVSIDPADTYTSLEEKLARAGAKLAAQTLPKFVAGEIKPREQDHAAATFTRKFGTADGQVAWDDVRQALSGDARYAERIHNMIRAFNPEPSVWTMKGGKRLKLLRSSLSPLGALVLEEVQWEGKKPTKYN
jgi:methionyl-tRNA formyltransferase